MIEPLPTGTFFNAGSHPEQSSIRSSIKQTAAPDFHTLFRSGEDDILRAAGTARAPAPGGLSLLSREYSNVSEFMTPPTSTLLPDYPAMAAHALDLIEMFLQRKQPPGDIACPGRLLIRDSVRDLRNQNFTTG